MLDSPWFLGITAFIGALIVGTFIEYLIHRLMHLRWVLGTKHTEHHAEGTGTGLARRILGLFPWLTLHRMVGRILWDADSHRLGCRHLIVCVLCCVCSSGAA